MIKVTQKTIAREGLIFLPFGFLILSVGLFGANAPNWLAIKSIIFLYIICLAVRFMIWALRVLFVKK